MTTRLARQAIETAHQLAADVARLTKENETLIKRQRRIEIIEDDVARSQRGHEYRQPALDALAGVSDAVWYALLHTMQGVNLVLANLIEEKDPRPCILLDRAISAEIERLKR